jgi:hypothetical protein
MALNNFARLAHWYRATTVAGPELQAMTQVFADPDGGTHTKTKLDGAGLSVSENENANNNKQPYNRSLVVGDSILWLQANTIYAWNTSTGANTTSHVLPSGANGAKRGMNTGLYQTLISGVPHIVTVHAPNDSTLRAAIYNVTTSVWENRRLYTTSSFSAIEASGGFRSEILYDNKLYFAGNRTYTVYNPQTDTYIEGRLPSTVAGPYDWCPYMGKLYFNAKKAVGGDIQIYEMVENTGPTLVSATNGFGLSQDETVEGRSCLFTDREHLYSIYYSSGTPSTGFGIYKFGLVGGSMSFIGDVTSTINLGSANTKNGSADANRTQRYRSTVMVNQSQNPDGKEGIVFYFDRGGGTGNHITAGIGQYYEQEIWDTNSTNLIYDDATFVGRVDNDRIYSFQMAYTNTKNGAGERIYNISVSPEPRIVVTRISTSGTVVGINYKIATNTITFPNGTSAAICFKYDSSMHSPRTNCYLQNATNGTIVGNRKVVVTANNSTDYYVEWNAAQDGFTGRVKAAVVPFISTTGVS